MLLWLLIGCATSITSPSLCSGWSEPSPHGQISSSSLTEASGLVASKLHDNLLWTHNDGDDGELFALDEDGTLRARMTLDGVEMEDWEDIATGIGPDGRAWLFLGDTGDNDEARETVSIWRIQEPEDVDLDQTLTGAEQFQFTFPDGPEDTEALLYDPVTEHILLITKHNDHANVYTASFDQADTPNTLQPTTVLDFSDPLYGEESAVTAADATADNSMVVLRTESAILIYRAEEIDSLVSALSTTPCVAQPADGEIAGEGLALQERRSETFLYTLGEGSFAWLYRGIVN